MSTIDFYDLLGVTSSASPEEIQAAWRAKVRVSHPDRGGDPDLFRAVTAAYETLSDPIKRAEYDRTAAGPWTPPPDPTPQSDDLWFMHTGTDEQPAADPTIPEPAGHTWLNLQIGAGVAFVWVMSNVWLRPDLLRPWLLKHFAFSPNTPVIPITPTPLQVVVSLTPIVFLLGWWLASRRSRGKRYRTGAWLLGVFVFWWEAFFLALIIIGIAAYLVRRDAREDFYYYE